MTAPTAPDRSPDQAGPLSGLLVADFSRVLAGPYATMLLADLGADVIKVESPAGDDTRHWVPPVTGDGTSTYFMAINRNKRSVALDLKNDEDLAAGQELARRADVFVENFKPGGLRQFGLDYDTVSQDNPAIVYASISGFGAGQGKDLPGYDLMVQAMSGLMSLTGDPDGPPFRAGISVFDVIAGLHTGFGILAALVHRAATGRGQHVEANLMSSALSGMVNQTSAWVAGGVVPFRMGNAHPSLFPYEPLPTKDGELIVTAGNDAQFGLALPGDRRAGTGHRPAVRPHRRPHRAPRRAQTPAYPTPVPAQRRRMVPGPDRSRRALRADQHGGRWGRLRRPSRPGTGAAGRAGRQCGAHGASSAGLLPYSAALRSSPA